MIRKLILILFLLCSVIVWSEEEFRTISKNIDLVTAIIRDQHNNNKSGYSSKILFKENNLLINEFDIDDNNPYLKFPYPIERIGLIVPRIDLKNANLSDLLPSSILNEEMKYGYDVISQAVINFHLQRFPKVDSVHINNIAVSYGITFMTSHDQIKYKKSTVMILNQKGEIIYTNELQGDSASQPTVTTDGKFLCVISNRSNKQDITDLYYLIYDTKKNKLLLEEKSKGDISVSYSEEIGLLILIIRLPYNEKKYIFYDFAEMIKYEKTYTLYEFMKIKKITSKGIVSGINSHDDINEKIDKFKEDFLSKDFK
ncbi:MAG: hypothetical protein KAS53_08135 [Candidatus Cloacimonetes bacterium]|nr:hypothetical protein [Candidatus Cloacimonadota bacterium]